jgi:plastocyanin domain-containing protein
MKHSLETKRKMSRSRGGASPELEKKVCDMYSSGISTAEIHKLLGVPRNSAWKILKRNGVQTRDHKTVISHSPEKWKEVSHMLDLGMEKKDIMVAAGVGKHFVARVKMEKKSNE